MSAETGASLDHAVWFHRRARLDDWVLIDLVPHTVAGGRGWYTGAFYGMDGVRLASIAQETLFRTSYRLEHDRYKNRNSLHEAEARHPAAQPG